MKHVYLRLINVNKESQRRILTKHFSFSTNLIFFLFFFFSFLSLFNIFLIHLLFQKNLPAASSKKKSHPVAQTKTFHKHFFGLTFHTAKHFSTQLPVILRLFIRNESHGWKGSYTWTVIFKRFQEVEFHSIIGALSSLRQSSATESPLKIMKNAFYFTLKAPLVLNIFKFLSWVFCYVEKRCN